MPELIPARYFPLPPGKKSPPPKGWTDQAFPLMSSPPNSEHNTAIPTGRRTGILVLDSDDQHGGSNSLTELQKECGVLPLTYTVRTPHGRHYYFAWTPACDGVTVGVNLRPGLDWRGEGGYVVAPPSVVDGMAYVAESTSPVAEAPAWLLELLRKTPSESAPVPKVPEGGRNAYLTSRAGVFRRTGMTETEVLAAIATLNVSRCVPPLDKQEVARIATSVSRYEPENKLKVFKPQPWTDLLNVERPPALVKNVLGVGSLALLYGPSGSYKSFLALDLAAHIALGRPWAGCLVRQGRTLYLALEGSSSLRDRLSAFCKHHDVAPTDLQLFFLPAGADLSKPCPELDAMVEGIKALDAFSLIVLDTLSRAIAGGDENSPEAMGSVVAVMDRLRAETGAAVLAIHHTGKDVNRGARGHSLLRAAVDSEFEVSRVENVVTLNTTKQRDIGQDFTRSFEMEVVEVGHDEDGEAVSSLVLKPTDKHLVPDYGLSGQTKVVLEVLRQLLQTEGVVAPGVPPGKRGVTEERWRVVCSSQLSGSPDTVARGFRRSKEALVKKRVAKVGSGYAWVEEEVFFFPGTSEV
jgi:hypothetical protein